MIESKKGFKEEDGKVKYDPNLTCKIKDFVKDLLKISNLIRMPVYRLTSIYLFKQDNEKPTDIPKIMEEIFIFYNRLWFFFNELFKTQYHRKLKEVEEEGFITIKKMKQLFNWLPVVFGQMTPLFTDLMIMKLLEDTHLKLYRVDNKIDGRARKEDYPNIPDQVWEKL